VRQVGTTGEPKHRLLWLARKGFALCFGARAPASHVLSWVILVGCAGGCAGIRVRQVILRSFPKRSGRRRSSCACAIRNLGDVACRKSRTARLSQAQLAEVLSKWWQMKKPAGSSLSVGPTAGAFASGSKLLVLDGVDRVASQRWDTVARQCTRVSLLAGRFGGGHPRWLKRGTRSCSRGPRAARRVGALHVRNGY